MAGHEGGTTSQDVQKNIGVRLVALGWVGLVLGFLVFFFDPTTTTEEVKGTVTGWGHSQGRWSTGRTYFVVKLESGPIVNARAQGHVFRDKREALIAEETTALFRRKRYAFLRYIDGS